MAQQVAALVRDRATHLGFSQQSLAGEAGVSPASLRKVWQPTGQPLSIGVLGDISEALRWPRGSLGRLLGGEAPADVIPSPETVTAATQVHAPTIAVTGSGTLNVDGRVTSPAGLEVDADGNLPEPPNFAAHSGIEWRSLPRDAQESYYEMLRTMTVGFGATHRPGN